MYKKALSLMLTGTLIVGLLAVDMSPQFSYAETIGDEGIATSSNGKRDDDKEDGSDEEVGIASNSNASRKEQDEEDVTVATSSNTTVATDSNATVATGSEAEQRIMDFSKVIKDISLLKQEDYSVVSKENPIYSDESLVLRFEYKLKSSVKKDLSEGKDIVYEYQLPDDVLNLIGNYSALVGETFSDAPDSEALGYIGEFSDNGLINITLLASEGYDVLEKYLDIPINIHCGKNDIPNKLIIPIGRSKKATISIFMQYGFEYEETIGDVTIYIFAEDGVLPENTRVSISKVDSVGGKKIEDIISEKLDDYNVIDAFDISLSVDGKEIQPNDKVKITLYSSKEEGGLKSSEIFHIDDDGLEILDTSIDSIGNITFDAEHFSIFGIARNSAPIITITPTDDLHRIVNKNVSMSIYSNGDFDYIDDVSISAKAITPNSEFNINVNRLVENSTHDTYKMIINVNTYATQENSRYNYYSNDYINDNIREYNCIGFGAGVGIDDSGHCSIGHMNYGDAKGDILVEVFVLETETSDEYAQLYGKKLFSEWFIIENGTQGIERWNFPHTKSYWGEYGLNNYNTNQKYIDMLIKNEELNNIKSIKKKYMGDWNGSCSGMALSALSFNYDKLTPNLYDAGAQSVSEIHFSKEVHDLINYYHLLQYKSDFVGYINNMCSRSDLDLIREIEEAVSKGERVAVLFNYTYGISEGLHKGGHVVILYGDIEQNDGSDKFKYKGETYDKRIKMYDCNDWNGSSDTALLYKNYGRGIKYCFKDKISYNKSRIKVKISAIYNDIDFINKYNPENVGIALMDNNINDLAHIRTNIDTFTISNGDESSEICGSNMSNEGNLKTSLYFDFNDTLDGNPDSDINVIYPYNQVKYNISSDKKTDGYVSMLYSDYLNEINGSNLMDISFYNNGSVNLNMDKGDYEIFHVDNNSDLDTISISGEGANYVATEKINANDLILESDSLRNVTISLVDEFETERTINVSTLDKYLKLEKDKNDSDIYNILSSKDKYNFNTIISSTGYVHIISFDILQDDVNIKLGENYILETEIRPANADNLNLIWESSDNNVVTVKDGIIKAIGIGQCVVTATTEDGSYIDECFINVAGDNNTDKVTNGDSDGTNYGTEKISSTSTVPETTGSWIFENNIWYFVNQYGIKYKNTWIYKNGKWFFVDEEGKMIVGWYQANSLWYYFDPMTGAMKTGWIKLEDEWYYLREDGVLLVNTTTPDGYHVNEKGEWIQ